MQLATLANRLGTTGLVLTILGFLVMFAGVTLSYTVNPGVYYSATGLTYTTIDFTDADNGTTVTVSVGTTPVDVTPFFPTGVTGSLRVWFSDPLTVPQIVALGASDPSSLGSIYLLLDILVNWTVTGGTPTVYIDIQVPGSNIQAYWWTGTMWQYYPNQQLIVKGGQTYLRLVVTQELTGTPFALLSPSPVGGKLVVHGVEVNELGVPVLAAGLALMAASAGLYLVSRRKPIH